MRLLPVILCAEMMRIQTAPTVCRCWITVLTTTESTLISLFQHVDKLIFTLDRVNHIKKLTGKLLAQIVFRNVYLNPPLIDGGFR